MSNHHLAVKLGVEKGGETVFRRLNSSMLGASALGSVKEQAVLLYCSEFDVNTPIDVAATLYEVTGLYYYDSDGDKILILSDKDFYNTIKEYTTAKATSLKFIAKIARNETTESLPRSSMETASTVQDSAPSAPSVATQTAENEGTGAPKDGAAKNVIDALGDLMSIAAASVEAAVNTSHDVTNNGKTLAKTQLRAAKKASRESLKVAKCATRGALRAAKHATRAVAHQASVSAAMGTAAATATAAAASTVASVSQPAEATEASTLSVQPPPPEMPPFIHGRHTCDSCLTTPIVGKRYNALNLPDYDLCETCFGNYQGTDNVFVETVLERDIPYQERWTRKRAAYAAMKERSARLRQTGAAAAAAARSAATAPSAPVELPVDAVAAVVPTEERDDPVLQEAIRRSLEDATKKEESDKAAAVEAAPETVDSDEAPAPKDVVECVVEGETVEEDTVRELSEPEYTINSDEPEYVLESSIQVETVEESADELEPAVKQPPTSPAVSERDASFASEAAGSGAIAAFVGETLDRMSEAIESLNSQLSEDKEGDDDEDDSLDSDDAGSKIVDGEDDDFDSEESWSVVQDGTDNDREIARATEAIGSALFNSDLRNSSENVSAMSGMADSMTSSQSSESSSSSSDDDQFSSVTSVPTVVSSVQATAPPSSFATAIQRDRWAVQLGQLHELGIMNDEVSIAAIESLAAANIGVDSEDEVTVQQIVNKLMNW